MSKGGQDAAYPPPPPPAYGQPVQPAYGQPGQQYGQPTQYGQPGQYGTQYGAQPQATSTTVVLTQPVVGARMPGSCSLCGGILRDRYTVVGIILAVLCFPWGIICCLMMTERRCSSCGR